MAEIMHRRGLTQAPPSPQAYRFVALDARDRTVLSRFWLEFGFLARLQHGEISRRFGLNIFHTGQFDGNTGSASIT
jgi:hypothetical protein